MTIKSFIQGEVLLPRLKENGLLVVYDPDQWYRELCAGIATETTVVVEVGVKSSDLFSMGSEAEILLEAHSKSGKVVGAAKTGARSIRRRGRSRCDRATRCKSR
jgi:hypothetical protein